MKINHDAEIAAALEERKRGVSLEAQKDAAAATGKAVAIAVVGGEVVAYAAEPHDYTGQVTERKKPWRKELDALKADIAAVKGPKP